MTVVAVVNQKGGVGKTTVVLGLAASAWARGEPCIVVDVDPQANASTGLGVFAAPRTVDDALAVDRPGSIREVLVDAEWPSGGAQPRVAAGSPALSVREPQLANDPVGAQDRLRTALTGVGADGTVFIDCPPSLGLLTVNALFAADRVIVVTEPGAWAADGVSQIVRTVERVSARRPLPLDLAGIAVNKMGRTRDARYWHEQLIELHPGLCLPPIRQRAALPEAAAQSLPIGALGSRPGAAEAAAEFDVLYDIVVGRSSAGSAPGRSTLGSTDHNGDDAGVGAPSLPAPSEPRRF